MFASWIMSYSELYLPAFAAYKSNIWFMEQFVRLCLSCYLWIVVFQFQLLFLISFCFLIYVYLICFLMWKDNANFEGERCGICMDIVIDRGVLDCCQHWYISPFSSLPFVTYVHALVFVVLIILSLQNMKWKMLRYLHLFVFKLNEC